MKKIEFRDKVLPRLYKLIGSRKDQDIAKSLQMSQSGFSMAKTRDNIKCDYLITFCIKNNVSVDFLLFGIEGGDDLVDKIERLKLKLQNLESELERAHSDITNLERDKQFLQETLSDAVRSQSGVVKVSPRNT